MITWSGVAPSEAIRNALATFLTTVLPAAPDQSTLRLYQNDYTPNLGTVIGDLTEATFTGYAAVDVAEFSSTRLRSDVAGNAYYVDPAVATFLQTGTTITNTVYGYYLTDATGADLLAVGRFSSPVLFDHTGKALDIEIGLRLPVPGVISGDDTTESV